ncbi:MAG TPA: hypothetical protein PLU53_01065 [Bacteroidia bacterium]|nr:hypothetical protein [Bacteroidia bacterium]
MNYCKTILTILLAAHSGFSFAQVLPEDVKYHRSSLYTLMIDDSTRMHASAIKEAFTSYPVPDKFNDHNLKNRMIKSKAVVEDQTVPIAHFLNTNDIAKKLVAKWFNRNEKGAFNMNLVAERGFYNASEMDANVAKLSKRGLAMLADAGEELILNTFVLVSDFKYMSHEELVKKARKTTADINKAAGQLKLGGFRLPGVADAAMDVFKKGYLVLTTSYLYRLEWNDSVAAVFYNDYWTDSISLESKKIAAYDTSSIFKFTYIGKEEAWADWPSTVYSGKSEEQLIGKATIQALDAVIAKLQDKHEEFRTKTPLLTTEPLSAKIGLKEGLEAGDIYQVLELTQNEDGRTAYNKVGTIKVDKSQIWDNRYMATGDSINPVDRTLFKKVGGKDFFPGMLIKQK